MRKGIDSKIIEPNSIFVIRINLQAFGPKKLVVDLHKGLAI